MSFAQAEPVNGRAAPRSRKLQRLRAPRIATSTRMTGNIRRSPARRCCRKTLTRTTIARCNAGSAPAAALSSPPRPYGTDNGLQLASRQALGPENFRVVAVVAEDVAMPNCGGSTHKVFAAFASIYVSGRADGRLA